VQKEIYTEQIGYIKKNILRNNITKKNFQNINIVS
jgi:hypothetical protein